GDDDHRQGHGDQREERRRLGEREVDVLGQERPRREDDERQPQEDERGRDPDLGGPGGGPAGQPGPGGHRRRSRDLVHASGPAPAGGVASRGGGGGASGR